MNIHSRRSWLLQIGTMNMTLINCHLALQLNPFPTLPITIFTLLSTNFNEYAARIRRALRFSARGKLTSKELREAADLPPNTLLPVAKKMEEDGELVRSTDYSTQPHGHIYSLTKKGMSKL